MHTFWTTLYSYAHFLQCIFVNGIERTCIQESHAVAGKPRDAAVNSDRYQQPVGQK